MTWLTSKWIYEVKFDVIESNLNRKPAIILPPIYAGNI